MNPQEEQKQQKDTQEQWWDKGDRQKKYSHYFKYIDTIGQGAFGKVVRSLDLKTELECAVKIIPKQNVRNDDINRVRGEAAILASLNNENIVKFLGVFQTDTRLLIQMEYVRGGSMKSVMEKKQKKGEWFTDQEISLIMQSLLMAIAYFHEKNVVHRDLKPENILVDDVNDLSTIKIADFGLSATYDLQNGISFSKQCGTMLFMAPQFFTTKVYSKPIDIWSAAIIMYLLISKNKHPLYDNQIDSSTTYKQQLINPVWVFPPNFSDIAINLFLKLTFLDPSERYSASQALKHPWVTQNFQTNIPLTMNQMMQSVSKLQDISQLHQQSTCDSQTPQRKPNDDDEEGDQKVFIDDDDEELGQLTESIFDSTEASPLQQKRKEKQSIVSLCDINIEKEPMNSPKSLRQTEINDSISPENKNHLSNHARFSSRNESQKNFIVSSQRIISNAATTQNSITNFADYINNNNINTDRKKISAHINNNNLSITNLYDQQKQKTQSSHSSQTSYNSNISEQSDKENGKSASYSPNIKIQDLINQIKKDNNKLTLNPVETGQKEQQKYVSASLDCRTNQSSMISVRKISPGQQKLHIRVATNNKKHNGKESHILNNSSLNTNDISLESENFSPYKKQSSMSNYDNSYLQNTSNLINTNYNYNLAPTQMAQNINQKSTLNMAASNTMNNQIQQNSPGRKVIRPIHIASTMTAIYTQQEELAIDFNVLNNTSIIQDINNKDYREKFQFQSVKKQIYSPRSSKDFQKDVVESNNPINSQNKNSSFLPFINPDSRIQFNNRQHRNSSIKNDEQRSNAVYSVTNRPSSLDMDKNQVSSQNFNNNNINNNNNNNNISIMSNKPFFDNQSMMNPQKVTTLDIKSSNLNIMQANLIPRKNLQI